MGNCLQQTNMVNGLSSVVEYVYDDANRLTSVNGVTYTWDNNGNLLNDGVNAYTYTAANRLKQLTQGANTYTYSYNGLGDRLVQNGVHYTLDLNTGLTQVLSDGTNTYLYGVGRIAQVNAGTEYFLGDALGSVRQLVDSTGNITLAKSYQPYGTEANAVGSGLSSYGFTGEMTDPTGLIYLRSRYYASGIGRFLTQDTWGGDYNRPLSLNRWMYVEGNPINAIDPSGHSGMGPWCEDTFSSRADAAEKYVNRSAFGDYLNTYTAAGIGVQCRGTNWNASAYYSGKGIAQITLMQTFIEWGEPIYEYDQYGHKVPERENWYTYKRDKNGNIIYKIRGYGLRLCVDGKLEEPLNPNDDKDAVVLMWREIKLVTDACVGCTPTDIYIAAALAQNGPGFNLVNMKELAKPGKRINERTLWGEQLWVDKEVVKIDWKTYFDNPGNADDTQRHLTLFDGVIKELRKRNWYVPDVKWPVVDYLKTIGD